MKPVDPRPFLKIELLGIASHSSLGSSSFSSLSDDAKFSDENNVDVVVADAVDMIVIDDVVVIVADEVVVKDFCDAVADDKDVKSFIVVTISNIGVSVLIDVFNDDDFLVTVFEVVPKVS